MVRSNTIRQSVEEYYRYASAIAILSAFAIDSFTLVRVDLYLTNLLLFIYLTIAVIGIITINLHEESRASFISEEAYQWLIIAMQFSFGGLFGRFLIYYSRSGSLFTSWPFLLILAGLLVGNEFAKKYYSRLELEISFFFLALFSYLIFFVPILFGRMGDDIFLISGYVSLLITISFLWLLSYIVPNRFRKKTAILLGSIGTLFLLMNLLYFTNIIPPIPLSLREAGAYHSVAPSDGSYVVSHEQAGSLDFLLPYQTIHIIPGESVSAYSAVFAPTNFDTSVVHDWQHYNTNTGRWESLSKITLPVVGGSDYGYRGYSIKTNLLVGSWRVVIETLRGQAVGALQFNIEYVDVEPPLIDSTL